MGRIWSSEGFTSEVVTVKPLINTEFTTSLAMQLPVESDQPWMSNPLSICFRLNLLWTAKYDLLYDPKCTFLVVVIFNSSELFGFILSK